MHPLTVQFAVMRKIKGKKEKLLAHCPQYNNLKEAQDAIGAEKIVQLLNEYAKLKAINASVARARRNLDKLGE